LVVLIPRPVLEVAVTAGAAVRVRSEHVTVTGPAVSLELASRDITSAPEV